MSNNSSDRASSVPVDQLPVPSAASAGSPNRQESQANPSAPINLNNAATLHRPSGLFDEHSNLPNEVPSAVDTHHAESRALAAAVSAPPVREQASQEPEGEGGRQVDVFVPAASASAQPSPVAHIPVDRAGEGVVISQPAGQAKVASQAGGALPPGVPPAPVVASCPEEPKPTPKGSVGVPPLLDVEAFIREAEDRKRGAKTIREITALADYIRQLHVRRVPFGAIHRGLKERGLVSCSRSRFDEICADLFPDLIEPKRRRNA